MVGPQGPTGDGGGCVRGRRGGSTIRCGVKPPNGTLRITVTPTVNGKAGKPIIRFITT